MFHHSAWPLAIASQRTDPHLQRPLDIADAAQCSYEQHKWPYLTFFSVTEEELRKILVDKELEYIQLYPVEARPMIWFHGSLIAHCWPRCQ